MEENFEQGMDNIHRNLVKPPSKSEVFHLLGEEEEVGSSTPIVIYNMVKTMISISIIASPYVYQLTGFGVGFLLLLLIAGLADYSLIILIKAGILAGKTSYPCVGEAAFGKIGYIVVSLLMSTATFIQMISFNIVTTDIFIKLLNRVSAGIPSRVLHSRAFVLTVITVLMTLPLSLYKDRSRLGKWSLVGLVCVAVLAVLIIVRMATLLLHPTLDAFSFYNTDVTSALGILSMEFVVHPQALIFYDSLENKSEKEWAKVTHWSMGTALTLVMIVGLIGYATFTGNSQGNILENYCVHDDMMNVGRFLFAISLIISFPLSAYVTREVISDVVLHKLPDSLWKHFLVTAGIVLTSYGLSLITDCYGFVAGLNGVLTLIPLMFILPPVMLMRLQEDPILTSKNIPLVLMAAFGGLVCIVSIGQAVASASQGLVCYHGIEPEYCEINSEDLSQNASVAWVSVDFNETEY